MLTEEEYKNIYSKVPRICVDLIILADNKFLLEKRTTEPYLGIWGLVGGGVQFGESLDDAIQRHAMEGIGVPVSRLGFLGIKEYIGVDAWRHSVALNYLVYPEPGALKDNVAWFDTFPEDVFPAHAALLRGVARRLFK